MSASIYGDVGGASRKAKDLYAKVGGVNRKIKEEYAKVNGVARKIYQNGVTWTYTTWTLSEYAGQSNIISSDYSARFAGSLSDRSENGISKVDYTFNNGNGFVMHTGQTIKLSIDVNSCKYEIRHGYVYINNSDSSDHSANIDTLSPILTVDQNMYDKTYTFTSDTLIRTIRVTAFLVNTDSDSYYLSTVARAIINSDYGSFLLNDSGKSN